MPASFGAGSGEVASRGLGGLPLSAAGCSVEECGFDPASISELESQPALPTAIKHTNQ
jgi:hypothetical protein